jgi:hypothetical protein
LPYLCHRLSAHGCPALGTTDRQLLSIRMITEKSARLGRIPHLVSVPPSILHAIWSCDALCVLPVVICSHTHDFRSSLRAGVSPLALLDPFGTSRTVLRTPAVPPALRPPAGAVFPPSPAIHTPAAVPRARTEDLSFDTYAWEYWICFGPFAGSAWPHVSHRPSFTMSDHVGRSYRCVHVPPSHQPDPRPPLALPRPTPWLSGGFRGGISADLCRCCCGLW